MEDFMERVTQYKRNTRVVIILISINMLINLASIYTFRRSSSKDLFEGTCIKYPLIEKYQTDTGTFLKFKNDISFRIRMRSKSTKELFNALEKYQKIEYDQCLILSDKVNEVVKNDKRW